MFRILHLSDIHIGKTYKDSYDIADKIAFDIDDNGLSNIDCIAVTGDIFDGQVETTDLLIDKAVRFFEILLKEINNNQAQKQISKNDIIFVPGNHDLIRGDDTSTRWKKYHSFLKKFYGIIPSYYSTENYSFFKEYKEQKIAFIGFNSCEIEKKKLFDEEYVSKFEKYIDENALKEKGIDKEEIIKVMQSEVTSEYDDYGYISLTQISPIRQKIKKLDDYTIVAMFHHHFYLFPEISQRFGDSSLIRNYTDVIQQLRCMNVSVVLHGHKHFALERPFITDSYYESSDNIIDVFAGGSVGKKGKEEHTFGILDLCGKTDDIKLRHNKFTYKEEKLEPIERKQVPPPKLNNRVVKLLEILKTSNLEAYNLYEKNAEKAFASYEYCSKIIIWVSEALTGFTDVYKYLDDDFNNILFLLYAVNYRTVCYMKIVGKEDAYFESASATWNSFYDMCLEKTDFMISKEQYNEMFMEKRLQDVAAYCDKLLNSCGNKKSQIYLAFTMLGMFFTDLYLVLTKYADDFKDSIQYKVNIKIEENKFHENVPAPRIVVKSDADRRSAYIEMLCNEATAHKMAVLFVKEFDLLINKFEDYFKIIGLKLYYLLPRIDKDNKRNTLDNYNFEAYIPTLIPLLTGDNIYSSKVVFARELIQNSIDAISVREEKDKTEFSKEIRIELKNDENGRRYFKIADCGTGMDRYKIERYFTSIGRSFYSGQEYEDLNISYKPISNFGIGFLSSFMVCQEIDVKTKYYMDHSEGLKLHIPNYDGCFFIELDENAPVGTEIKLYLNIDINNEEIVKYIERVMQDIRYAIRIQFLDKNRNEQQKYIPAHAVRCQNKAGAFKFFVPFLEDGTIGTLSYEKVKNGDHQYEYGLQIYERKNLKNNCRHLVLNSGISVEKASLDMLWDSGFIRHIYGYNLLDAEESYNHVIVNFPANWLQLDVARDSITDFSNMINCENSEVAECLYEQIVEYIKCTKKRTDTSAIYLQELILYAMSFCRNKKSARLYNKLKKLMYILVIEFTENSICYKIMRRENEDKEERIKLIYSGENAEEKRQNLSEIYKRKEESKYFSPQNVNVVDANISRLLKKLQSKDHRYVDKRTMEKFKYYIMEEHKMLGKERDIKKILKIFSGFFVSISDKEINELIKDSPIILRLEIVALQYFKIGEEDIQQVEIMYDELSIKK